MRKILIAIIAFPIYFLIGIIAAIIASIEVFCKDMIVILKMTFNLWKTTFLK